MAISVQLVIDGGGAGPLTRGTGANFGAPEMTRLQAAVDRALLANGISSPTNAQRADYLWARVRAELTNFVRAEEQTAASAAVSSLPV